MGLVCAFCVALSVLFTYDGTIPSAAAATAAAAAGGGGGWWRRRLVAAAAGVSARTRNSAWLSGSVHYSSPFSGVLSTRNERQIWIKGHGGSFIPI